MPVPTAARRQRPDSELTALPPAAGSLAITMSHQEPADAEAKTNWLPAPEGQFALIIRAYVPTRPILDGSYEFPNVERATDAR